MLDRVLQPISDDGGIVVEEDWFEQVGSDVWTGNLYIDGTQNEVVLTQNDSMDSCKQLIHVYLFLYHIVVVVVGNAVRCYHDKVEGAIVLRQLAVCVKLVLQVLCVIIVYGECV